MKTFVIWVGVFFVGLVLLVVISNLGMSPEDKIRYSTKDAVRAQLRDGGSAQFGEIRAHKDPQGLMVACGTVNAKNAFGAYVGPRRFIRLGDTGVVILEEMGADTFQGMWETSCASAFF